LELFSEAFDTEAEADNECCICFGNRNAVQFKPCEHVFCIACSNKIIDGTDRRCPYCRGHLEENLLMI